MELLSKIERLSSENLRNEYVMETQLKKINELERTISELEAINSDNLSMIEALRMTNADQEESISEKAKIIKQIEQVLPSDISGQRTSVARFSQKERRVQLPAVGIHERQEHHR